MGRCVVCGAESDRTFTVTTSQGQDFTFDSFECAVDRLAPRCAYCGIRIIGHGVEARDTLYCGAHCAQFLGIDSLV
ncbi:MAG: hypothetical protein ABWX96_09570 [Propionibacteriaceae bacterium]